MYLIIEENPNCPPDERVFPESGEKRPVKRLQLNHPVSNAAAWFEVAAVDGIGGFGKAIAQRIEDSSDGTAWLISGGDWGLRLKPSTTPAWPWSLTDKNQWGLPFLVLDSSGSSIEFE